MTSLICNQIVRIAPDRGLTVIIAKTNQRFADDAQTSFDGCRMVRDHLGPIPDALYQHLTSIAFGGEYARSAWMASARGPGRTL